MAASSTENLSSLIPATNIWGGTQVYKDPPGIEEHTEVAIHPFTPGLFVDHDPYWGLYDMDGRLIDAAAFRRLGSNLVGQSAQVEGFDPTSYERLPLDDYVYGGVFLRHFGHFIVTSIARLWWLTEDKLAKRKLLFQAFGSFSEEFSRPYVPFLFDSLGIAPEQIMIVDRPLIAPRITIPRTSFEEQAFSHTKFADLCRMIGKPHWRPKESARWSFSRRRSEHLAPVYLSKTHLPWGLNRIKNENIVEDYLVSHGFAIRYPEHMSFSDQIRLFSEPRTIMGSTGSAFHVSAFTAPESAIYCYSPDGVVNSNMILVDGANGNRAEYYEPITKSLKDSDDFASEKFFSLSNPKGIAQDLLTLSRSRGGSR